jgi:hypothetical protein
MVLVPKSVPSVRVLSEPLLSVALVSTSALISEVDCGSAAPVLVLGSVASAEAISAEVASAGSDIGSVAEDSASPVPASPPHAADSSSGPMMIGSQRISPEVYAQPGQEARAALQNCLSFLAFFCADCEEVRSC